MSTKNFVTVISILAVSVITLFIYPSTDKLVNAGQSAQKTTSMTNVHRISVSSDAVLAHYFGKDIVEKTLRQPGCVGVRTYYGKHENGKSGFILVGVDKFGKDIVSNVIAGPIDPCLGCW